MGRIDDLFNTQIKKKSLLIDNTHKMHDGEEYKTPSCFQEASNNRMQKLTFSIKLNALFTHNKSI